MHSLLNQRTERRSHAFWDDRRSARRAIDPNVNEMAARRRIVFPLSEQSDLVPDGGFADFGDAQTRFDHVGKRERLVEAACGLDDDADRRRTLDIEPSGA